MVSQTLKLNPARAVMTVIALAGLVLSMLVIASPAFAQQGDPAGNNGTIKVDREPFDTDPNNEPHVDCIFEVDFYGYDAGDLTADLTFVAHPPTGGRQTLVEDNIDIGEDAAGGGTDLDASRVYDLSAALAGIEPHPNQGYHVKLTINAEGSQGADVKHKVFWVQACAAPTSPPPGTESPSFPATESPTPPGTGGELPGRSTPRGGTMPDTASDDLVVFGVPVTTLVAVILLFGSLAALAIPQVTRRTQR